MNKNSKGIPSTLIVIILALIGLVVVGYLVIRPGEVSEGEDEIEGRFCGGFAANLPEFQCPEGYECVGEGEQGPDSGGVCMKKK